MNYFNILLTAVMSNFFFFSCAQWSHAQSMYTSIDERKCWTPSKALYARYKGHGVEAQECKAPNGWKLFVVSSDERSWIDLQRGDRVWTTEDEVVYKSDFGNFPNIGSSTVEWILDREGRPISLIFRITAQSTKMDAPMYASVARLFVIGLTGEHPGFFGTATTNEKARSLVMKTSKPPITLRMLK